MENIKLAIILLSLAIMAYCVISIEQLKDKKFTETLLKQNSILELKLRECEMDKAADPIAEMKKAIIEALENIK